MSIYIDKVHIYCDHENCDNEVMIDDEELGSNDWTTFHHPNGTNDDVISDYAFNRGWVIDSNGWNKVSCPDHDDGN